MNANLSARTRKRVRSRKMSCIRVTIPNVTCTKTKVAFGLMGEFDTFEMEGMCLAEKTQPMIVPVRIRS